MRSLLFSYLRQSRACQPLIVRHQPSSPWARGPGRAAFQPRRSALIERPASPWTGTSTATFLLMLEGSMSMWIFFEAGEKASSRPVTRSSKRAPTFSITSQSCIAMLASYVPCIPSMPRKFGSLAGTAPRPISVVVTGNPVSRTSRVSARHAAGPEFTTPPPA